MSKFTVDFDKEDTIQIAIKQFVLDWCKKHNPEVFKRAEIYIRKIAEDSERN